MRLAVVVPVAVALIVPAAAQAQQKDPNWVIMAPEPGRPPEMPQPWITPTYKSPRGLPQHVRTRRHRRHVESRRLSEPPPPIIVPQTGLAVPTLPTLSPSGPHGTETFQDKALRCTHQAGAYSALAGDRSTYIGSCVNQ